MKERTMARFSFRRWQWLVVFVGVWSMAMGSVYAQDWQPRQLDVDLFSAGSSFPAPPINAWAAAYAPLAPKVDIFYNPSATSEAGQDDFVNRRVDFGVSDIALSADLVSSKASDTLNIPVALSGAAIYYNLNDKDGKRISGLRFSPTTLAGMYLGDITAWNDGRIQADNPGVVLPTTKVFPVHHSGYAGINAIFTDYLASVSDKWRNQVETSPRPQWRSDIGTGVAGNAGVADKVRQTKGAIGYLDVGYASKNNLSIAPVLNRGGNYVLPNEDSLKAAAGARPLTDNLAATLTDPGNSAAYPIAGYMYVFVRKDSYSNLQKAQALTDFLYWCLTNGNQQIRNDGFTPLTGDGRSAAINALRSVRVNGEQVFDE
jgi:phosphate transport system substrate-binding protein